MGSPREHTPGAARAPTDPELSLAPEHPKYSYPLIRTARGVPHQAEHRDLICISPSVLPSWHGWFPAGKEWNPWHSQEWQPCSHSLCHLGIKPCRVFFHVTGTLMWRAREFNVWGQGKWIRTSSGI